jgi:sterol desaturase/sphingolipid hydroxylase (fatty acid hydroxylase superfamily)
MDLTSWLFVSDDLLWGKKVSMISASLVFSLAFTLAWYAIFRIGIRFWGKDKAQAFAISKGYENYSEIVFDFTRNVFGGFMLFIMLSIFVYFVTYQTEVKGTINCVSYKTMADECTNRSGFLTCQKIDNTFLLGNSSLGWNGGPIEHSIQPS